MSSPIIPAAFALATSSVTGFLLWGMMLLVEMWVAGSSIPSGTVIRNTIMSSANLLNSVIIIATAEAVYRRKSLDPVA